MFAEVIVPSKIDFVVFIRMSNLQGALINTPAVNVDGEEFVVVDAPVFALADKLSEQSERDVFRCDGHLLAAIALEEIPLAVVLSRKPTFRDRRRQQI